VRWWLVGAGAKRQERGRRWEDEWGCRQRSPTLQEHGIHAHHKIKVSCNSIHWWGRARGVEKGRGGGGSEGVGMGSSYRPNARPAKRSHAAGGLPRRRWRPRTRWSHARLAEPCHHLFIGLRQQGVASLQDGRQIHLQGVGAPTGWAAPRFYPSPPMATSKSVVIAALLDDGMPGPENFAIVEQAAPSLEDCPPEGVVVEVRVVSPRATFCNLAPPHESRHVCAHLRAARPPPPLSPPPSPPPRADPRNFPRSVPAQLPEVYKWQEGRRHHAGVRVLPPPPPPLLRPSPTPPPSPPHPPAPCAPYVGNVTMPCMGSVGGW
jgi:hypothetical protein